MLIGGLGLIYAFAYRKDLGMGTNFFSFCLKAIAPLVLGIILFGNIQQEAKHLDLMGAIRWGWLLGAGLCAVYLARKTMRNTRMQEL